MEAKKSWVSAFCKLETQESWWSNSKGWELESWWCGFQSGSESLRTGNFKGKEDPCLSSSSQAESRPNRPLPCSIQAPSGMMSTHVGKGHLAYLVCWFKCSSFPETSPQTHKEIMFKQLSGHPLAQASWLIKLTITNTVELYPPKSFRCMATSFLPSTASFAKCPAHCVALKFLVHIC